MSAAPSPPPALPSTETPARPRRRWVGWLRDGALMLLVAFGVSEMMANLRAPGLELSVAAPQTMGTTLDGAAFDLASLQGKPVFVNLWATWCPPCRVELPDLAAAAKVHPEVQFVGLTLSSEPDEARKLIADAGITYPVVLIDSVVEAGWKVTSVPSSVLLDAEGRVVWRRAGMVDEGDVVDALELLARPAPR